jgi:hypothetical protein
MATVTRLAISVATGDADSRPGQINANIYPDPEAPQEGVGGQ